MLYKEIVELINENPVRTAIRREADNAYIPIDIDNCDYQEFLRLCDEQGEENILEAA